MKLYIVRHGDKETAPFYNDYLRHMDPPLSDAGQKSANSLAGYFEQTAITGIIASEYRRAQQTAQYVAERKGFALQVDGRLNEIDNGITEQMSDDEIKEKYPEFLLDFFRRTKDVRFPEGETGEEVRARQNSLLRELTANGGDILLVSHEGYIRLMFCNLLGLPVYKRHLFKVDFCGVTEVEYHEGTKMWSVIRVNQTP